MNPASERNNNCERCGEGNEEMSSWAYVTGADYGYCGGSNATSIELDKIKVFCENEKKSRVKESTNVAKIRDFEKLKNSDETSSPMDQSGDSYESSGQ